MAEVSVSKELLKNHNDMELLEYMYKELAVLYSSMYAPNADINKIMINAGRLKNVIDLMKVIIARGGFETKRDIIK